MMTLAARHQCEQLDWSLKTATTEPRHAHDEMTDDPDQPFQTEELDRHVRQITQRQLN